MKILIIGGVAGGMATAFKAKRENPDLDICVLEQEDYISFGACGLPYYTGDVFDEERRLFARRLEDAVKQGIQVLQRHRVDSVDFDKRLVQATDLVEDTKKTFSYDQLVIATGAQPIQPKISGVDSNHVYSITKPYVANILKEKIYDYENIAIIGGGFIGVEMAEQLSKYLHLNISLFHSRDRLLNRVYDREASKVIEEELKVHRVKIYLNERLRAIESRNGAAHRIVTDQHKILVDAVILATGFRPNTGLFEDPRLDKLDNGAIVIDDYGRTSIKGVWAVGDCATVPHKFLQKAYIPLATSANKIGRQIGTNICRKEADFIPPYQSLSSSSLQVGDLEFATTGLTEDQARDLGYDYEITMTEINNKPGYMPNSRKINFLIIYEKESFKILGARTFGPRDAVLRILPLTTAIHAGITTKDLAYYDFPYSPPFSLTWEAINTAANSAK